MQVYPHGEGQLSPSGRKRLAVLVLEEPQGIESLPTQYRSRELTEAVVEIGWPFGVAHPKKRDEGRGGIHQCVDRR